MSSQASAPTALQKPVHIFLRLSHTTLDRAATSISSPGRAAVDIPVIASLNGTTNAGWVHYAGLIEQVGATALELNIYRIASGPSERR